MRHALPILLALCAVACSDGPRVLIYPNAPPTGSDAGPDVDEAERDMSGVDPTGECNSREGRSCTLTNGAGICVEESCQLVACSLGFANCTEGIPGCERSVMLSNRCGTCDTSCRSGEACQLSSRGYVCSAGVVCLPGEFDLDRSALNGCEWSSSEVEASVTQPGGFFRTEAVAFGPDRTLFAAGTNDDSRFVIGPETQDRAPLTLGGEEIEVASAIAAASNADHGYVLWEDRITRHDVEDGGGALELDGPCAGTSARELIAAASDSAGQVAAATSSGVGFIEDPTRVFDQTGYLRAFYPYADAPAVAAPEAFAFGASEVAACVSCAVDLDSGVLLDDPRCDGARACSPRGFDASTCGACVDEATTSCPSFFPVDIDHDPGTNLWFVTTRRGLVVLTRDASGWAAVARAESAYEPGTSSGARFMSAAVAQSPLGARVFMLHSTGYVRAVDVTLDAGDVTLAPAGADVGLPIAVRSERPVMGALDERFVALGDTDRVLVLSWAGRSARMFQLVEEGIGVPTLLALQPDPLNPDGFIEARELFATLQRREVFLGDRVLDSARPGADAGASGEGDAGQ